jgi:hypothetical protein
MIEYKTHLLEKHTPENKSSNSKLNYFICSECKIIFYQSDYDLHMNIYNISQSFNKISFNKEILTCNEYIIKQIIE